VEKDLGGGWREYEKAEYQQLDPEDPGSLFLVSSSTMKVRWPLPEEKLHAKRAVKRGEIATAVSTVAAVATFIGFVWLYRRERTLKKKLAVVSVSGLIQEVAMLEGQLRSVKKQKVIALLSLLASGVGALSSVKYWGSARFRKENLANEEASSKREAAKFAVS